MTGIAVALLVLGLALAEPVSRALARARWPTRDPIGALLLWQAVGLAGGLALIGAGLAFGLSPWGDSPVGAFRSLLSVRPLPGPGGWHAFSLAVAAVLAATLCGQLGLAVWRTVRARGRHRDLVDLLATPWPALPGARVLSHPLPVAYCLPGIRSRLVLSSGALETLGADELAAVIAHERAHLRERHDLVVLPFVAWGATAPFVPGMVRAQAAVAALVEMRADDVAAGEVGGAALAGALRRVAGTGGAGVVTSFSEAAAVRAGRLVRAPRGPGLHFAARALVRVTAFALVAVPTLILFASGPGQ